MFEVCACIESGGLKALAMTNPTVAMGEQHARMADPSLYGGADYKYRAM
jgi:hypothetical protein